MVKRDFGSGDKETPASERDRRIYGRNLKAARTEAGLSTHEVERRTGVPRSRLAQIEAGQINITIETMTTLARLVGHDLVHLLTETAADPDRD